MNNPETPILDDKNTDTESVLSSADETLDELYSLLGDSSSLDNRDEDDLSIDIDSEIVQPSITNSESQSVMEELEAMYGNSDHVSEDDTSVDESVSVMDELEAMYGSATTPTMDDEPVDFIEGNTSSLDELEALLGDSFESSAEEVTEEIPLESTADSSNEVFEANDAGISSSDEYLFENRKPVLEELQNLLQSSVEELKERADSHIGKTILALDMEYPTRNELITLLEEKLNLLNNISDTSGSDSFDGSTSVLEEFNALMSEAGSSKNTSDSTDTLPNDGASLSDEVDEYVSYINSKYKEFSSDEDVAESVIPDEFDDLLSDTDNTVDAESSVEADVLNQLEELMAETAVSESESVSKKDIKTTKTDSVIQRRSSEREYKTHTAEAHRDRLRQPSLAIEANLSGMLEAEKRFPMGIMFLAIAVIGGAIIFWNLFGGGEEPVDHFQSTQTGMVENIVSVEPVLDAEPKPKPEVVFEESSIFDPAIETDESPVEPPVVLVTPDLAESMISETLNEATDTTEEIKPVWSVHLFSYHNQPPAESELAFLKKEGISYEIKQATVKGELWYRVQAFKHSEYSAAKEYAEMLGKKHGIKGIWLSKGDNN